MAKPLCLSESLRAANGTHEHHCAESTRTGRFPFRLCVLKPELFWARLLEGGVHCLESRLIGPIGLSCLLACNQTDRGDINQCLHWVVGNRPEHSILCARHRVFHLVSEASHVSWHSVCIYVDVVFDLQYASLLPYKVAH